MDESDEGLISEVLLQPAPPKPTYPKAVAVISPNGKLKSVSDPHHNTEIMDSYQADKDSEAAIAQQEKNLQEAKQQKAAERKRKLKKVGLGILAIAIVALGGVGINLALQSAPAETHTGPSTPPIEIKNASGKGLSADFGGGSQRIVCRTKLEDAQAIASGSNAARRLIVATEGEFFFSPGQYCVSVRDTKKELFTPTPAPTPSPTQTPVEARPTDSLSNAN